MSVTRLGVPAENVVATIDIPNSHQGILRPDRKKSEELRPARCATRHADQQHEEHETDDDGPVEEGECHGGLSWRWVANGLA